MDQPVGTQSQAPQAPVQPATPPPPPQMPPASNASRSDAGRPVQGPPMGQPGQTPPTQKKSNAWIWILGGCLGIVILGIIAFVALGWWGARKAKRELEKYQPNLERMKENMDKFNQESQEWEKKSKEFQENLPNPEDMQSQFPAESSPSAR